ncbi:aldo/keto reductase [Rhizobium jaguaris]|uniref:Aldo/keto reductase n=1 Tax=Rhizobium jaguaris TaxID=1312183 RepID=A0A387G7M6_9HYPH|nr:aldo/keto reductase [Rhizobium jaguaris]AYG63486.1 aldo/keto reductase [Rhizobium jaguaris]
MRKRRITSAGLDLTEVGFGAAGIAGLYVECSEETAQATLDLAWHSGIRYFDTAPFYGAGLSEERVGRFLAGKRRDDYVISTKVGRLLQPAPASAASSHGFVGAHPCAIEFDYSGDGILRSLEASIKRTGLDRFDILYVHDIGTYAHGEDDNARHMQAFTRSGIAVLDDLKASSVIKGWGLGVNEVAVCLDVLERTHLDCILIAGRYTLLDRRAEERLIPLCAERGTSLVVGGVFNSGILATGAVPGARFDYAEADADILERVGRIEALAAEAGTDIATAALQFPLQNPAVASVLIGSADTSTLRRNLTSLSRSVEPSLYEASRAFSLR